MSIYTDEFWDAQAAKLTDTSQILKTPWEEKRGKDLELKESDWTVLDNDYADDYNYVPEDYDLRVEQAVLAHSKWIHKSIETAPNTGFDEMEKFAKNQASDAKRLLGAVGEAVYAYQLYNRIREGGYTVTSEGIIEGSSIDAVITLHPIRYGDLKDKVDLRMDVEIGPDLANFKWDTLAVFFYRPNSTRELESYKLWDVRFDIEIKTWRHYTKEEVERERKSNGTVALNLRNKIKKQVIGEAPKLREAAGERYHVPIFLTDKTTWEKAYAAKPKDLEEVYEALKAQQGRLLLVPNLYKDAWGQLHAIKRKVRQALGLKD